MSFPTQLHSDTLVDHRRPLPLDSALVQKTKDQIRDIVEMIAILARSPMEPQAFLAESLPRIVTAMGAIGAGLWEWTSETGWTLMSQCSLEQVLIETAQQKSPSALLEPDFASRFDSVAADAIEQLDQIESQLQLAENQTRLGSMTIDENSSIHGQSQIRPTTEHLAILEQVRKDQQPTLVPPGNVALAKHRPINPTSHLLIYAPIPIPDEIGTYWLQVVQPPSGGPASQRGFLRFVSQMADLLGDYLKTYRLRLFERDRQYLSLAERTMMELSLPADPPRGLARLMGILREHASAEHTFLLRRERSFGRWRVVAAAGLVEIDGKSEGIRQIQRAASVLNQQFPTGGSMRADDVRQPVDERDPDVASLIRTFSIAEAHWVPLLGETIVLMTWSGVDRPPARVDEQVALVARLGLSALQLPWWKRVIATNSSAPSRWRSLVNPRYWSASARVVAALAMIAGIGAIPVPLSLTASATLIPSVQQHVFAPVDAIVDEVLVEHGEHVTQGQILLRLKSPGMAAEYDQLIATQLKNSQRFKDIDGRLLRGAELTPPQRDELEGERETLLQLREFEIEQLARLKQELDSLAIYATLDGVIATWNVENVLRNRPLRAGQWLLSLHQESTQWNLEAALPERDTHSFASVLDDFDAHPPIATLTTHPQLQIPVRYIPGGLNRIETVSDVRATDLQSTTVLGLRFALDASQVPAEALVAGGTARVRIPAGHAPLCWAFSRDFLLTLWAKARLWM